MQHPRVPALGLDSCGHPLSPLNQNLERAGWRLRWPGVWGASFGESKTGVGVGYPVHVHQQQSQATSQLAGRQCAAAEGTGVQGSGWRGRCVCGCVLRASLWLCLVITAGCMLGWTKGQTMSLCKAPSELLRWLRCGAGP